MREQGERETVSLSIDTQICSRLEPTDESCVPRWVLWEGVEGSRHQRNTYDISKKKNG